MMNPPNPNRPPIDEELERKFQSLNQALTQYNEDVDNRRAQQQLANALAIIELQIKPNTDVGRQLLNRLEQTVANHPIGRQRRWDYPALRGVVDEQTAQHEPQDAQHMGYQDNLTNNNIPMGHEFSHRSKEQMERDALYQMGVEPLQSTAQPQQDEKEDLKDDIKEEVNTPLSQQVKHDELLAKTLLAQQVDEQENQQQQTQQYAYTTPDGTQVVIGGDSNNINSLINNLNIDDNSSDLSQNNDEEKLEILPSNDTPQSNYTRINSLEEFLERLENNNLQGCDLRQWMTTDYMNDINEVNTKHNGLNLSDTNLEGAQLTLGPLKESWYLNGANLTNANLNQAELRSESWTQLGSQ